MIMIRIRETLPLVTLAALTLTSLTVQPAAAQQRTVKEPLERYQEALRLDPEDGPSRVYRARCEAFIAEPPEWLTEDWDGAIDI